MKFLWGLLLPLLALTSHADEPARPIQSLTMTECIERALRSNLDIRYQQVNPQIGAWGIVYAQGVYDPNLQSSLSYGESTALLDPQSAISLGVDAVESQSLLGNVGLGGLLPSGAQYNIGASQDRESGSLNSEHVYTGGWLLTATQPLLKNAWFAVNSATIRIARKNYQISQANFTQQVMDTIVAVKNAYYELIFSREDYKATVEDLNSAKALLAENRKRVEVGVLSPLDVTQAEAGAAEREEAVVIADRAIRDAENTLKRLITQDVSEFAGMELLPADRPDFEMVELDVARSTKTALERRPEYAVAQAAVERQDIDVKYKKNQLWPEIDLFGTYGYNARSPLTTNEASSYNNYLDNVYNSDAKTWTVGIAVTYPLGNRQSRSNYRISRLTATQTVIDLKRVEQNIVIEVDTAVGKVATDLKRIDATRVASRLAEESLQAEQQKLRAGTSTSFLVLQAQAQLATARSAEIRARADYDESLVALARAEGTTLMKNKVVLEDIPNASR